MKQSPAILLWNRSGYSNTEIQFLEFEQNLDSPDWNLFDPDSRYKILNTFYSSVFKLPNVYATDGMIVVENRDYNKGTGQWIIFNPLNNEIKEIPIVPLPDEAVGEYVYGRHFRFFNNYMWILADLRFGNRSFSEQADTAVFVINLESGNVQSRPIVQINKFCVISDITVNDDYVYWKESSRVRGSPKCFAYKKPLTEILPKPKM